MQKKTRISNKTKVKLIKSTHLNNRRICVSVNQNEFFVGLEKSNNIHFWMETNEFFMTLSTSSGLRERLNDYK